MMQQSTNWRVWFARAAVCLVLVWNLTAAIPFVISPGRYLGAFQVTGTGGEAMIRGLGIAFLMWQIPFLPVVWSPQRQRVCYVVVLAMQMIGLIGESLMLLTLPAGNAALRTTGARFIGFDATGLLLMGLAYLILQRGNRSQSRGGIERPADRSKKRVDGLCQEAQTI